ncbi:hypothetical protein [Methylobacterium sp. CM6244]
MDLLPNHGRVSCTVCHSAPAEFDAVGACTPEWRIRANPLSWGSASPEILVLGFSKGPTQAGDLARTPHDAVAFKGQRVWVGRILARLGLLDGPADTAGMTRVADGLISDRQGRFAFGSLVRCTVERFNGSIWKGTGGDMLGGFVSSAFGRVVGGNCTRRHLGRLPDKTRLVVMMGTGSKGNYVDEAERLIYDARGRPASWRRINAVAYGDGSTTFVHTVHFAAQGRLRGDWFGQTRNDGSPPDPTAVEWAQLAADAALDAMTRPRIAKAA